MMQVSKKIPFEDPQVLMVVRALYIISNIIIVGVYLYVQNKINRKKGAHITLVSLSMRSRYLLSRPDNT